MNKFFKKSSQGLSLIETMVGLSVITVGVTAMVGTAIYSFSTYYKSVFRFTALSLAQEGTDVVRNLRDTNWLPPQTLEYCGEEGQPGYIGAEQYCYKSWLTTPNDLTGCVAGCQAVFAPATNTWSLANLGGYELYLQENSALYTTTSNGSPAIFYRKVKVTQNTAAPYSSDHPELMVTSTVAWVGRSCPDDFSGDPESAQERCKVVSEDRLTNWKNY